MYLSVFWLLLLLLRSQLTLVPLKVTLTSSSGDFNTSLVWLDVLQFHYGMSRCGYLCIYPLGGLLGFLALFLVSRA